jgi:hypothetical protein
MYNISDDALEAIVTTLSACTKMYTMVITYIDPCSKPYS